MRLEQLQNEFPKMPEELRARMEKLVAEQIGSQAVAKAAGRTEDITKAAGQPEDITKAAGRTENITKTVRETAGRTENAAESKITGIMAAQYAENREESQMGRRKRKGKVRILMAAAAVAVLGTTALAAAKFGWFWNSEQTGNYGLNINIQNESTKEKSSKGGTDAAESGETGSAASTGQIPEEISLMNIQPSYIPEGMMTADPGVGYLQLTFQDRPYQGGITFCLIAMDDENSGKTLLEKDVANSETIMVGGHEAVSLELNAGVTGGNGYTRRLYVLYPEYWYVMQMFISEDVPAEEVEKIAEGIRLVPTGETQKLADAYTWSDYVDREQETEMELSGTAEKAVRTIYQIGEAVPLQTFAEDAEGNTIETSGITATVADFQIADDLSPLGDLVNSEYMEETWKAALDENGKLLPDEVKYVKQGDGIETVDELAASELLDTSLVYLTVEYTNNGAQPVYDLLFYGQLAMLEKEGEAYVPFQRQPSDGTTDWDYFDCGAAYMQGEMDFYDVRGGARGNNYIDCLAPGETVTVHMGYFMHTDELDKLYLNLQGDRGGEPIDYVDLRS